MHTKKIFQVALAASLTASAIVMPIQNVQAAPKFTDIGGTSEEMKAAITNLVERKIISGYPDGTFKPGNAITRTQAAKILAGTLKLDTKNVKNPNFKDVKVTDPNYGAIAALANKGIISGSNGYFNPTKQITRGQMSKMIIKGFELPIENVTLPFKDVPVNSEYAPYIKTLYANKITEGKTSTTYDPQGPVTRGHLVVFVTRAEKAKGNNTNNPELSGETVTLRAKDYNLAYIQAYYGGKASPKDAVFKWDQTGEEPSQSITLRPTKEGTSKLVVSGASLQGNSSGNDTAYLVHVKKVNGSLHLSLEKVNETLHAENENFYSSFDEFDFIPSKVTVSTLDGKMLPSSEFTSSLVNDELMLSFKKDGQYLITLTNGTKNQKLIADVDTYHFIRSTVLHNTFTQLTLTTDDFGFVPKSYNIMPYVDAWGVESPNPVNVSIQNETVKITPKAVGITEIYVIGPHGEEAIIYIEVEKFGNYWTFFHEVSSDYSN